MYLPTRKTIRVARITYILYNIAVVSKAAVDIIKCFIYTHRVSVSVFAHNVEQIAYGSDHDARLAAMSDHRMCFTAARCPVREHGGVKTDEYVFHQAFRRLFIHFILNEFNKKRKLPTVIIIVIL